MTRKKEVPPGATLWGGRFAEQLDPRVMAFTSSFAFDIRLLPYDVQGSMAHARMLAQVGILKPSEAKALVGALEKILRDWRRGSLPEADAEDVHSYVEHLLRLSLGDLAGKLHTGRSRNDQVALDIRLYLRDKCRQTMAALHDLKAALVKRADEHRDAIMPGFTHLQPAMPILLAHHLLAYFEMFDRDTSRLADAVKRADESPLGAGALAGTSLPLDRKAAARLLGFGGPSRNSLDAVSERDFPLEYMAAASLAMVHASRLAEELVLWASPAFGFISLPDRLATGSSMMPQKKNPDVAELIRGKSGRVFGHLMGLLTVMKGLPLAYQRDLQEDKEALFDTVDTCINCFQALTIYLDGIVFKVEKMAAAAGQGYATATDLAEYLVTKGLPFRQAHHVVGAIVRHAEKKGAGLDELTYQDLAAHSKLIRPDVIGILSPWGSVRRKSTFGSTKPAEVAAAIRAAKNTLAREVKRA